jgi:hypothetical protein
VRINATCGGKLGMASRRLEAHGGDLVDNGGAASLRQSSIKDDELNPKIEGRGQQFRTLEPKMKAKVDRSTRTAVLQCRESGSGLKVRESDGDVVRIAHASEK